LKEEDEGAENSARGTECHCLDLSESLLGLGEVVVTGSADSNRLSTILEPRECPISLSHVGPFSRLVNEEPKAPLFLSSMGRRLCLRQLQRLFTRWQVGAGFDRPYNFHSLRHTAITNVYRATKDLFLTQRFARHANPITTVAYTHPSDEELYSAIAGI